jgi:hypothetical protein
MSPSRDSDGVEYEPHLRKTHFDPDPSESSAARNLERSPDDLDARADQSVWDEPTCARELAGDVPGEALTLSRWLAWRWRTTSALRSWSVTVLIVLCAGPWAVVGAFMSRSYGGGGFGFLAVCVFAPAAEELLKASSCLLVVERRPYLFRSPAQILLCCLASGLVFAAIENVLYLHVYVARPSEQLVFWRWTICVVLHAGCTLCTGMGLARAWSVSRRTLRRPDLSAIMPYLLCAVTIHGVYNGIVTVFSAVGYGF